MLTVIFITLNAFSEPYIGQNYLNMSAFFSISPALTNIFILPVHHQVTYFQEFTMHVTCSPTHHYISCSDPQMYHMKGYHSNKKIPIISR